MNPYNVQKAQDINITNQEARIAYYLAAESGNYQNMINIIYDTAPTTNNNGIEKPELVGKVVIQEFYNGLIEYFNQAEGYLKIGVYDFLTALLVSYQIDIDNITNKGVYSATEQYYANNCLIYNNYLYFVKSEPPIGTLPTDTNYFVGLGLRGIQGYASMGILIQGTWDGAATYNTKDAVIYNSRLYVAKRTNTNIIPSSSTDDWEESINLGLSYIPLGSIEDFSPADGSIWFQTN